MKIAHCEDTNVPMATPTIGKVVILNGTSSAGTTSLAQCVHDVADTLWIVIGQDDFTRNLIPTWVAVDGGPTGEHGDNGIRFVRDEAGLHTELGPLGRAVLRGYRRAAAAVARSGLDVIVDEANFDPDGWDDWQAVLAGIPTLWVRVECDLEVCEKREAARADRALLPGLARGQHDRVHRGAEYDLVVDTSDDDLRRCARQILAAARPPTASH
jgi:chloramphenicol 3-O phosphotransferase